ncbi:pilus assembly FimT family protein [Paenibacillus ferrarius]|uniref:pilus assembly FimT family protein n=1 Tax=Paenibacillus ferrarius TaxID=1469647 RepID=UPI003D2A73E0
MLIKMMNRLKKEEKGFTLIELLAVIVILAVIAAIAVPYILGVIDKSKKNADVATFHQVYEAARLYVTTENVDVSKGATIKVKGELLAKNYLESGIVLPSDKTKKIINGTLTYSNTGALTLVRLGVGADGTTVTESYTLSGDDTIASTGTTTKDATAVTAE